MAQLCHDQYDHPLLWCDSKRRAEERRIASESLVLVQQRKEQAEEQRIRESNELRQLIEKHYPWGRPGGGAPNENIRRGNILSEGLFPEPNDDCRKFAFQAPYRLKRGGGGAPLRNSSGQIITTYHEDPNIAFSDSARKHVENHLRYKTSAEGKKQYKLELDKCIADRKKMRNSRNSIDSVRQDPWGKCGPGGAPWRNPGRVGESFMKSMGWTDKTLLRALDQDANRNTGPPDELDESPFKANNPNNEIDNNNRTKLPAQCCANCFCDCKARYSMTTQANKENVTRRDEHSFKLCDHTNMHKNGKKCKYVKPRSCMISGGVELVPLLARRRAMQRPISLSTTDVTKYPTEKKWQDYGGIQLLDDLCRQMSQKERRQQISKDSEMESARVHFETLDTFWGRPGHGAPQKNKNKLNLNDLLYKPHT